MITDKEISEAIDKVNLSKLAKQCLSIVESSTLKDDEIELLVFSAIFDMQRRGIEVLKNIENSLVKGAIMMYVKANFGMTDIKEKALSEERYNSICINLSLSQEYKKGDDD